MLNRILPVLLLLGTVSTLSAQKVVKLADSKEETAVTDLTLLNNGGYEYSTDGGKTRKVVSKEACQYVWIPMPEEIKTADQSLKKGDFVKAEQLYRAAYASYKLLGWDVYCIWKEAEAMAGDGRKKDALDQLEQLRFYTRNNPRLVEQLASANRLNVELKIESGDVKGATELLDVMGRSLTDSEAFFSFMKRGDILASMNLDKDAALLYVQAAMLFPKAPERPLALWKTANLLDKIQDPGAKNFREILRKDYPDWKAPEQK